MKKTILPIRGKHIVLTMTMLMFLFLNAQLWGQGMTCNTGEQVSLGPDCVTTVEPDEVLEGTYPDYSIFEVIVTYPAGTNMYNPPNQVDDTHIGGPINVEVFNTVTQNACWGSIIVEDKLPPILDCPQDYEIDCEDLHDFLHDPPAITPVVTENCDLDTEWWEDDLNLDQCDAGTITRTFYAKDASGNVGSCSITVTVSLNDRPDVIWPDDLTLDCPETIAGLDPADLRARFGNNNPWAYPRTTNSDYCGTISFSHTDEIFDVCLPDGFKIRRTWTALDWCDGQWERSARQYILVQDTIKPSVVCPPDIIVSTQSNTCDVRLTRYPISATDNCDSNPGVVLHDVEYLDENGNVITTGATGPRVSPGIYYINYPIADRCGNTEWCQQQVVVQDNVPPVAICDQNTVISLTSDGWGELCYETIDDNSSDNCEIDKLQLRIPDQVPPNGQFPGDPLYESSWSECVVFYCADLGDNTVEMRVVDYSDNENKCWANVLIEDKLPPAVLCPPHVTVDCNLDITDLDNTGHVAAVMQYQAPQPGDGVAWAGCSLPDVSYEDFDYDGCVGTFSRVWTASKTITGHNGPLVLTAQCTQYITLVDNTPAEVTFPEDLTLDCENAYTDPAHTGEPELVFDCEQLGVSKSDELFDICLPTGYKIRRTWHVIDWCDSYFDHYHTQIIKVQDVTPPTIDVDDVTVPIVSNSCDEYVTLIATAEDDCSTVSITNDSPYANSGGADASGRYPKGIHEVTFTATDACGNFITKAVLVKITDQKAPTPVCLTLSIDIKSNGQVEVTPPMVDGGSNDNCTSIQNLQFLLQLVDANDNPLDDPVSSLIFDCNDLGVNYVRLWVFDGSPLSSNGDYCVTTILVQDNFGNCPSQTVAQITGTILTADGQPIQNVDVYVDGNLVSTGSGITATAATNQTHLVTLVKDDNLTNGVSTFDILTIRKHLLNLEPFISPYQYVAADVNKSNSISTIDLVNIRRALLNLTTEFPNDNTSWRFIDAAYSFTTNDPLNEPFPEYISMHLVIDEDDVNFIGVKVGDVTGNADPSLLTNGVIRNEVGEIMLIANDQNIKAGDMVTTTFKAGELPALNGYQFTLNFDQTALEFINIESTSLVGLGDDNFGLSMIDRGVITTSWDQVQAVSPKADEPLFTITFRATEDLKLSNALSINSAVLRSEAYDANGNFHKVGLTFRTDNLADDAEGFTLFQNTPNPFNQSTTIGFNLSDASDATLTIFDVTGKVIHRVEDNFAKGYNTVKISKAELSGSGLLYYELVAGEYKATKKMLILE